MLTLTLVQSVMIIRSPPASCRLASLAASSRRPSLDQCLAGLGPQRRHLLEQITDDLSDFELELSYSVEASSHHTALYESMCLADRAQTVARMLQKVGASQFLCACQCSTGTSGKM